MSNISVRFQGFKITPSMPSEVSVMRNSCSISVRNVDITLPLPFNCSSKPVNADHHFFPSEVCTACKRIAVPAACITASCTSAEGGSTATMNCPCSRIRLRTTVSACARSSSVGSCCNARIAYSIFSFPCKPLSFFSSIITDHILFYLSLSGSFTAYPTTHIYAYHTIKAYAIPLTFPSAHFPSTRCLFLDSDYIHC